MDTFEQQVQKTRKAILTMAQIDNLEIDVLLTALADVLGDTAAGLDRMNGPMPIEDRLAQVLRRAKETYGRTQAHVLMLGRRT